MNTTIFKEYDIRGTYPTEINEETAYIIGKSYGSYIQEKLKIHKCVIGHDNRLSSPSLYENMKNGILNSGCNVIDYGLVTTPMHYYTRYLDHTMGIMVTASHNPKDDNGFKFSFDSLANARGKMIVDFKEYTLKGEFLDGKGLFEKRDVTSAYLKYMQDNIQMGDRKLKVVIDPGNGTTSIIVKECHNLFPNLDITYICAENDGTFPNHHPDPAVEENLTFLKEKVLEEKADIGISYDGDGDRLGIIDEFATFVPADKLLIIALRAIRNEIQNPTFLYDVKCTKALEDEIRKLNAIPYMERTGTSYTEATTKEKNIPLGGELSGHIFFNDRGPEICSGIYDGLRYLEILSKTNLPFSKLLDGITEYISTPEIKIPCANENKFSIIEKVKEYVQQKNYQACFMDGARVTFEDGWALIRASNTGPNITLRFEAKTKEFLNQIQKEFTLLVTKLIS
ncbi:MAG: phosphomannomutase/phosphoglucomutase [Bacilli bacterium]|jgi:phosphomannomutase/phosphoglucomutase|nr:phosphomannomutase/phosphoglucomutase [Bacilli bacterium]